MRIPGPCRMRGAGVFCCAHGMEKRDAGAGGTGKPVPYEIEGAM